MHEPIRSGSVEQINRTIQEWNVAMLKPFRFV
jgi:hypothetical protein